MVSFELGKDEEKHVFFCLITSKGKKILRPSDFALNCFTTEPQRLWWARPIRKIIYMTCILHAARISNVISVMFCKKICAIIKCQK